MCGRKPKGKTESHIRGHGLLKHRSEDEVPYLGGAGDITSACDRVTIFIIFFLSTLCTDNEFFLEGYD
jgi:hypothetical protein